MFASLTSIYAAHPLACNATIASLLIVTLVSLILSLFVERPLPFRITRNSTHILITGGSSGIGLETARQLLARGARLTLIARNKSKLDAAVASLQQSVVDQQSGQVQGIAADCSDAESITQAVQRAMASFGNIQCAILCAGITEPGLFVDLSQQAHERLIQTNLLGTVYTCRALVPHMQAQSAATSCRLLIVSSMAGLSGVAGYTAYSASKFALRGLAESLHMELAHVAPPHARIFVSLVSPPDVDTESYAAEQLIKPRECKLISEGTGVFSPQSIARDMITGALDSWRFLVNSGFDGRLLETLCAGTAPLHSVASAWRDLLGLGLIRTVSLAYRWHYNRIVTKCSAEKHSAAKQQQHSSTSQSNGNGSVRSHKSTSRQADAPSSNETSARKRSTRAAAKQ